VVNRVGRAESFSIGALRFAAPTVVMPDSGGGYFSAPGTLGNIGGQLLERCRVTFDYPHARVRFEPVDGFDRPFEADMSGAVYTRTSGGYEVRIVEPGTPAAEAGLRVGDIVSTVNGDPAEGIAVAALKRTLQQDGKVVRFGVRRGADSVEIAVTLRRMI
jgi:membrane-associated protease RseP (regulator of RpoE activity)